MLPINRNFASVQSVDFSAFERVIAISDIHGDFAGFNALLSYINWGEDTALVIVGDILEKGAESLQLLKRIAELSETGRLYMVLGNNDTLPGRWYAGEISDESMRQYVNACQNSVFINMANELHLPWQSLADIQTLKEKMGEHYKRELTYLSRLPHILESDLATFVHAGIEPGDLHRQNPSYCLAADAFSEQGYRFEKPVVAGHWPASNYRTGIIHAGVHFNAASNIYSIDGGNSMKSWQQINLLTFSKNGTIACDAFDRCAPIRVLEDQESKPSPLSLMFPKTLVEIRETMGDQVRCLIPYLGEERIFDSGSIYSYKNNTYCRDFTTYFLPVKKGEIVSYCGAYEEGILIKRKGVVGKYCGSFEWIEKHISMCADGRRGK